MPYELRISDWSSVVCTSYLRDWPRPTGHLNDTANVVDAAYRDSIEALAVEVREKTGSQIALLTVPDLGGEDVDAGAEQAYRPWGVGRVGTEDGRRGGNACGRKVRRRGRTHKSKKIQR